MGLPVKNNSGKLKTMPELNVTWTGNKTKKAKSNLI